ncbi:response regulator [Bacteroidota bacterium]
MGRVRTWSSATFFIALKTELNRVQKEEPETDHHVISPEILRGKTIVIAEDEEFNYRFLEKLITMQGGEVIWATTGQEVIDILENNPDIDLIMMDLKMPVMNGFEATKIIKISNPEIPIIAQTAFALFGDSDKAMEAGCNDYIAKPIMVNELMQKLKLHLNLN